MTSDISGHLITQEPKPDTYVGEFNTMTWSSYWTKQDRKYIQKL